MPDSTLSQALKEAYAAAPSNAVIYHTLEIRHPAFTTPIRVVRDKVNLIATLESGAPVDASTAVTFVAFRFNLTPPEVSASGSPTCTVEIDNVGREVMVQIEAAQANPQITQITYRQYISSDLSAPQNNPPIALDVIAISADPFKISMTCGFDNLANRRFPRQTYNAERFPGLIG